MRQQGTAFALDGIRIRSRIESVVKSADNPLFEVGGGPERWKELRRGGRKIG